jgi:hypothetical protein
MGRTLTNNFGLQYAKEETIGVLPTSPEWHLLEPNAISTFGATISTVARSPISKNRQRRKGTVVDLDSAVEFDADLTLSHFVDFVEGFVMANFVGPVVTIPTACDADSYTVPTLGAAPVANTLIYVRGFAVAANNGLKVVDAGATTTDIPVTDTLVAEAAPPDGVELAICGIRGATGDIDIDADGNLFSTALDFTTLGLTAGQSIWIGGTATANKFVGAANRGFARVVSVTAHVISLDKKSQAFVPETGTGLQIDIFIGRFLKNVGVDDGNFLEQSFQFEGAYTGLDNPTGDMYEYSKGNFCNTMSFDLPLTDKATVTFGFIGTDTAIPTDTQETNADTPIVPNKTAAFNTSADIARLRIQNVDEEGLSTDFKSLSFTLNNNVSPEKVLANLGARFMNTGNLEVDIEAQLLFSNAAVVTAIRENTRLSMDFSIRNEDGTILVDIPSLTLGGGDREFPVNESVLINTTAQAYGDAVYGNSIGITLFAYTPAS